ncbi:MAG: hypothetical protein Q8Q20_01010 [bacterium]|nr:hypothetical protein [bacterium]
MNAQTGNEPLLPLPMGQPSHARLVANGLLHAQRSTIALNNPAKCAGCNMDLAAGMQVIVRTSPNGQDESVFCSDSCEVAEEVRELDEAGFLDRAEAHFLMEPAKCRQCQDDLATGQQVLVRRGPDGELHDIFCSSICEQA